MVKNDDGRFVLVGVTSFGFDTCGQSHLPGYYANVSYVVDWIHETINLKLN